MEQLHSALPRDLSKPDKRFPFYTRIHYFQRGDSAGVTDTGHDTQSSASAKAKILSGRIRGEVDVLGTHAETIETWADGELVNR